MHHEFDISTAIKLSKMIESVINYQNSLISVKTVTIHRK